jgi:3-oxoacyl-[acyl-carrier protein] reductase
MFRRYFIDKENVFMGKKIILTGGSRGIGKAVVEQLAREGNAVAFNYHANAQSAESLVQALQAEGHNVAAFQADIVDFDQAARFIAQAKEFLGDVDALVNNAGITRDKSLFIMPPEDWHAVINTNLNGYFNVTRNIIGYFMKNKRGCIVNMTSVSGLMGLPGQTNYCASKAGIIGFTRSLAKEIAKLGIPVNCIAPGFIETDMTASINPAHIETVKKQIPMQRLGTASEVADLVSFLVSDKARYITGQVFVIDGGLSA